MRNQNQGGDHAVAFQVINSAGEVFSEIDTPTSITKEIHRAIGRKQRAGVVYGGGSRWAWSTVDDDLDVVLEFERGGNVVERYTIPWQGWEAFKIVAARQGKSGKDYLTLLLGTGMAEGEASRRNDSLVVFGRSIKGGTKRVT